jgi:hypothetical protein
MGGLMEISSDFLLALAGVAATLVGTFLVGVFFYMDSDGHRRLAASEAADLYLRSGIRWVFIAYSLPVLVPLTLAAFDPLWGALVFIALGSVLVLVSIDTGRRILKQGGSGMSRALFVNEWITSAAVVVIVVLPWVLGGWVPTPGAFVPSLLIALVGGFTSTAALVMTQFDATMGMPREPEPPRKRSRRQ